MYLMLSNKLYLYYNVYIIQLNLCYLLASANWNKLRHVGQPSATIELLSSSNCLSVRWRSNGDVNRCLLIASIVWWSGCAATNPGDKRMWNAGIRSSSQPTCVSRIWPNRSPWSLSTIVIALSNSRLVSNWDNMSAVCPSIDDGVFTLLWLNVFNQNTAKYPWPLCKRTKSLM